MQTGWRLERTYLAGAGYPDSRLEGLDINWSDPVEPTGHAALWADNGTGKTTITALRFALYLPNLRDFVRGDSDRSLARLVYSGNVCHIVEQATRQVNGELQRIVMGMVADWPDGGTQDLDNPSRLRRDFYGWVASPHGPSIGDLPFRTESGRWETRAPFVGGVRAVPAGGRSGGRPAGPEHRRSALPNRTRPMGDPPPVRGCCARCRARRRGPAIPSSLRPPDAMAAVAGGRRDRSRTDQVPGGHERFRRRRGQRHAVRRLRRLRQVADRRDHPDIDR